MNKGLMAVTCIVVIAVGGLAGVYILQQMSRPPIITGPTQWIGTLTFNIIAEKDAFDLTANAGASPSYVAYHMKTPGIFPIASKDDLISPSTLSTSAAVSVGITQYDNRLEAGGYKAYLVLHLYGGTADYLDLAQVLAKHPWVKASQIDKDIDGDGFPDVLALADLSGLGINMNQPAFAAITSYLMVSDVTLTDNDPADITGIGTTGTYKTVTWQFSFSTDAEKKATCISRIYVSGNRTDDYVQFKEVTITSFDGTQKYISTSVSTSVTPTAYTAYFFPALNIDYRVTINGFPCKRSVGSQTFISVMLKVYCTFPGNAHPTTATAYSVSETIYVQFVGPNNSLGTVNSDAQVLDAHTV